MPINRDDQLKTTILRRESRGAAEMGDERSGPLGFPTPAPTRDRPAPARIDRDAKRSHLTLTLPLGGPPLSDPLAFPTDSSPAQAGGGRAVASPRRAHRVVRRARGAAVVRSETRPGAADTDRERRAATVKTRRRDRSGETSGLDDASRWGEAGLLREKLFRVIDHPRVSSRRSLIFRAPAPPHPFLSRAEARRGARSPKMGKRKTKKRSNSTLKVTSYFKRFQVKFARRRAGACRLPSRAR